MNGMLRTPNTAASTNFWTVGTRRRTGVLLLGVVAIVGVAVAWNQTDGGPTSPAAAGGIQVGGGSPTGRQGVVDSDPDVLYPGAAAIAGSLTATTFSGSEQQSTLQIGGGSPTGRHGVVDSDPDVIYLP
ncbi:MAG: hypothetical protein AB7J35_09325 [Dehalococcoidia bacterium]